MVKIETNNFENINNQKSYSLIEERQNITTIGKIVVTQKRHNFIVSVCKQNGDVIFNLSPGIIGYKKGNRKNPLTYKEVAKELATRLKKNTQIQYFEVIFKGICKGKNVIVNTLNTSNINIFSIINENFHPKNGCKPKKQRRL